MPRSNENAARRNAAHPQKEHTPSPNARVGAEHVPTLKELTERARETREMRNLSDQEAAQRISDIESKLREGADPISMAESSLRKFDTMFQSSMQHGTFNRPSMEMTAHNLTQAKQGIEGMQAWLRQSNDPKDQRQMEANWRTLKQLDHALELLHMDPNQAFREYAMDHSPEKQNIEKLTARERTSRQQLERLNARADELSAQLQREYGISPEQMIAGARPKTFGNRFRLWLNQLTGSDALLKEWRTNRDKANALDEEIGPSLIGRPAGSTGAEAIVSARQTTANDAAEAVRREGRLAAEEEFGSAREKTAAQLEAEYLGEPEEVAPESGTRAKRATEAAEAAEREQLTLAEQRLAPGQAHQIWNEVNLAMGVKDESAARKKFGFTPTEYVIAAAEYVNELRQGREAEEFRTKKEAKEHEKAADQKKNELDAWTKALNLPHDPLVGLGASRLTETRALGRTRSREALKREAGQLAGLTETPVKERSPKRTRKTERPAITIQPEVAEEEEEVSGIRKKAKREVPKPPESVMRAGKQVEREMFGMPMDIETARVLVPDAAKLWDLAAKAVKKHPDASLLAGPLRNPGTTGTETDPATQYVYTVARYISALKAGNEDEIQRQLADVKRWNDALGLSGNALVQKALAEKRGVKDVMRGSRQRAQATTRRNRRISG